MPAVAKMQIASHKEQKLSREQKTVGSYSVFIVPKQRTPSSSPCWIKKIRFKDWVKNDLAMKNASNLFKLTVK